MSQEKILTISVAAYNIEQYIEKNLESFVNSQVNDLIEVIVVDDGSKDNTTAIVQKYVDKYPNTIKLVKQKNAGPGATVNTGLRNATGKYFKMVDGDDWVETKNLNILVENLCSIDTDMIITNNKVYDNSKEKVIGSVSFELEDNKVFEFKNINNKLSLDMHNVAYRTSILKENKIILDNGFYTDVEFLLLPMPFVNNVIYYNMDIYVYRIAREGQSVSLSSFQKNIKMHDIVLKRLIEYYEEYKMQIPENVSSIVRNRLIMMADKQLQILLSFEPNNDNKNKIKEYFKEINFKSKEIYSFLVKLKKGRLLLLSNYKLYYIFSKYINKKSKY